MQMDANLLNARITTTMGKFLEAMGKFPSSKQDFRDARQHLAIAKAQIEKAEEWFNSGWLDAPEVEEVA